MAIPMLKMATIGLLPSWIKKIYYRSRGAIIGKNVNLGIFSIITANEIHIGDNVSIAPFTFITVNKLKLGNRVKIGTLTAISTGEVIIEDDSTVMEFVIIGGMQTPISKLYVGKRVKIFPYSFINPTEPITFEDDVAIGGHNAIFTHGSWQNILDGFPVSFGPVTIKKGAWLPWRVQVMPNTTIGEYATIGAGSIINKDIPGRSLAAGVPGKVLKKDEEYIKQYSLEEKKIIVDKIIGQFIEYMEYLKYVTSQKVMSENSTIIEISNKKSKYAIHYCNEYEGSNANFDYVICVKGATEEETLRALENGRVVFNIFSKTACFRDDVFWYYIRDFFSRYGIRFNSLN